MLEDIYDFYKERNGIMPYDGDYAFNLFRDRDAIEFGFTYPYSTDNWEQIGETWYQEYEINLPVITTLSEENQVDEKVSQLLSTTFASVRDGSDEEKVKAVYNYVKNHVRSSTGDRRTPLYHTGYCALIKGHGTCEAYAYLFNRLTRELGVPSKVILGIDSNNHTYNIARVGDYWYYFDCSNGRYMKDAKSFSRAKEQDRFLEEAFISNYLSRIKNSSYEYNNSSITVTEYDQDLNILAEHTSEDWDNAAADSTESDDELGIYDWVIRHAKANSTSHFMICFNGNKTIETYEAHIFDFEEYADRVGMDLQGYTLSVKGACEQYLWLNGISNGTLKVPKYALILGSNYIENTSETPLYMTFSDLNFKQGEVEKNNGTAPDIAYQWGFYTLNEYTMPLNLTFDNVEFDSIYVNLCKSGLQEKYKPVVNLTGKLAFKNGYFYAEKIGIAPGAGSMSFTDTTFAECANETLSGISGRDYVFNVVPVMMDKFRSGDVIISLNGKNRKMLSDGTTVDVTEANDVVRLAASYVPEGMNIYQIGNNYVIAKPRIHVSGGKASHDDFVQWSDAVKYLDSLNDSTADYEIIITSDIEASEILTLPSKAASVRIRSLPEDISLKVCKLLHMASVKLLTDLILEDVEIGTAEDGAAFDLNGKNLTLSGNATVSGTYAQMKGAGSSALIIDNLGQLAGAGESGMPAAGEDVEGSAMTAAGEVAEGSALTAAGEDSEGSAMTAAGEVAEGNAMPAARIVGDS
ncbi:MAG: transglutaminase-like domain-containing protein, partial [Lachnospiraceae bacterium]|nr:transglutaminase-like domain-containing protein [Lachnospiraceae bacterium]